LGVEWFGLNALYGARRSGARLRLARKLLVARGAWSAPVARVSADGSGGLVEQRLEERKDPLRRKVAQEVNRGDWDQYRRLPSGEVAVLLLLSEPVERCDAIEVFCVVPDLMTAVRTLRQCELPGVHRPKAHGSRIDPQALAAFERLGPPFVWRPRSSERGPWQHVSALPGIRSSGGS
jgi:hypothetical protein